MKAPPRLLARLRRTTHLLMRVVLSWRPAGTVQCIGLLAVFAGLWLVYPPVALVLSGAAVVLWAEGQR